MHQVCTCLSKTQLWESAKRQQRVYGESTQIVSFRWGGCVRRVYTLSSVVVYYAIETWALPGGGSVLWLTGSWLTCVCPSRLILRKNFITGSRGGDYEDIEWLKSRPLILKTIDVSIDRCIGESSILANFLERRCSSLWINASKGSHLTYRTRWQVTNVKWFIFFLESQDL